VNSAYVKPELASTGIFLPPWDMHTPLAPESDATAVLHRDTATSTVAPARGAAQLWMVDTSAGASQSTAPSTIFAPW